MNDLKRFLWQKHDGNTYMITDTMTGKVRRNFIPILITVVWVCLLLSWVVLWEQIS